MNSLPAFAETNAIHTMQLTEQQKEFFEAFGFLQFPGVLKNEIGGITEEFRAAFDDQGVEHTADKRTCLVPFIDQREKLCALLDHPVIRGIASGLLGPTWNYTGSDGNYYTGDTGWHPDGNHLALEHLKIAFYLDPVARESGALRVIPGSHKENRDGQFPFRDAMRSQAAWGIEGREVPSIALESTPGDVVCFNHNLMHAAFGGGSQRRMFTINLTEHAATPDAIEDLKEFVSGSARFWIDEPFSQTMRNTATPERLSHLEQVLAHSTHLPELAAKARATMSEPARG